MQTVGSCPQCGAPIYSPNIWHGVTPPPITYSCICRGSTPKIVSGWDTTVTQNSLLT